MKALVLLVVLCATAWTEYVSYAGYKVFQIYPRNEEHLEILKGFTANRSYDFWFAFKVIDLPVTIMVTPEAQPTFIQIINKAKMQYRVMIEDVESKVVEERGRQVMANRMFNGGITFNQYHRYNEIQNYLKKLTNGNPDIAKLEKIGTSYENRIMNMIKIGTKGNSKPIILVDGGIHAREWISPAFVTYLIQELVENKSNSNMIKNIDWYIIPVLNPDGYEYTHTKDRFWRKTRSPITKKCRGVDPNRNFGFHWMEIGASRSQCSETYAGPKPFSESETSALKNVVTKYQHQIKLYLTFHSFGRYLLYPWGYTSKLPDDADELKELATQVEKAIASVNGTRYTIGSSTNVLSAGAGGSDDWVKGVGGVNLSYTVELPGDSEGISGFDLPATRIQDVCIETFEGVKVFHQHIEQKFTKSRRQ